MDLQALIGSGELGISQFSADGERIWPLRRALPQDIAAFEAEALLVLPRPFRELLMHANGGQLTSGALDLQFFGVGEASPGLCEDQQGRPRYLAHLACLPSIRELICFGSSPGLLYLFDSHEAVCILETASASLVQAAPSLPMFWRARRPFPRPSPVAKDYS